MSGLPRLEGETLYLSPEQFVRVSEHEGDTVFALRAIGLDETQIWTVAFKTMKLVVVRPNPIPSRVLP